MKVTLESTDQIVWIEYGPGEQQAFPGRIWEGKTASGIYVQAVITRIAAPKDANLAEFQRDLSECVAPVRTDIFPLRMVL